MANGRQRVSTGRRRAEEWLNDQGESIEPWTNWSPAEPSDGISIILSALSRMELDVVSIRQTRESVEKEDIDAAVLSSQLGLNSFGFRIWSHYLTWLHMALGEPRDAAQTTHLSGSCFGSDMLFEPIPG
jgi:hypothetical protein